MKHRRLLVAATAAGCLTVTWLSVGHAQHTPQDGQVRAQAGGGGKMVPVKEALAKLHGSEENAHDGYSRDKFDLYVDADGDGCDARREVLIAEALKGHKPKVTAGCHLTGGKWYSAYDGETVTSAEDMTIDHVVALGEAWDSGANEWPSEKLVEYGNYLKDPRHLIAVTGPSNSYKSDKDPAEWSPPRDEYLCEYVRDWVQVKTVWDLTVDVKEKAALEALMGARDGECAKMRVRVP